MPDQQTELNPPAARRPDDQFTETVETAAAFQQRVETDMALSQLGFGSAVSQPLIKRVPLWEFLE